MYLTILKFLGGNAVGRRWKEIGLVSLLAIVVYQNVSGTRWVLWADTIPYLKEQIAIQDYELDIITQANESLTNTLEERNEEIARWSDVTRQLELNTALLQDEISNISTKTSNSVRIVEKQIIPQECSGAMNFLYDSIPELNYDDLLLQDGIE